VTVCTSALGFTISKERFSLIETAALGTRMGEGAFVPEIELIRPGMDGDATVRIRECFIDADGSRRIYGLGGDCRASLAAGDYRVTVEEAGPLRAVIRCDGKLEADIPAGHYGGYRPFHFTTRIHAYAGHTFLRVLHTLIVACNPRETEVEEIALRVPFAVGTGTPGNAERPRYRIGMRREFVGALHPGASWLVSQRSDRHCRLDHRVGERAQMVAEDERGEGWVALEDDRAGIAIGLRHMAEEYPKALGIAGSGDGIDVYLWRDPDGKRLAFRRSSEEVHWGQGEGIYADGTGSAKTSEYFLHFYRPSDISPRATILGLLTPPHAAVDPVWQESGRAGERASGRAGEEEGGQAGQTVAG
jgi:hypothetical protein